MIIINTDSLREVAGTTVCHITDLPRYLNQHKKLLVKTGDNGFDLLERKEGLFLCGHSRNSIHDMALLEPLDINANRIFANNIGFVHPHFTNVPLGVYAHSLPTLESMMPDLYFSKKSVLVYANFTNWCGRDKVTRVLKNCNYVRMDSSNLDIKEYYTKISQSCFNVCPKGNGIETYRFWESLCLRSYPIVLNHPFYDHFKFLPFIRLNMWEDMYHPDFQNFLLQKKMEFDKIQYEPFLTEEYWRDKIENDYWGNCIAVVGNSHANMFTKTEHSERGWSPERYPFVSYSIGAGLAWKFGEKYLKTVQEKVPQGKRIMLAIGEIDCRVHIVKQAALQNRDPIDVCKECVDKYFESVLELNKTHKVICWGNHPTTGDHEDDENCPRYGDLLTRNRVSKYWSDYLGQLCENAHIPFVTIVDELLNEDGTTKTEFYDDYTHLKHDKVIDMILSKMKAAKLID